jgi:integrase
MSTPHRHVTNPASGDHPPGQRFAQFTRVDPGRDDGLVRELVQASTASATRRAYAADWVRFTRWCMPAGVDPTVASDRDVARYLAAAAASLRPDGNPAVATATLRRWISGINQVHAAAGGPIPGRSELVRRTLSGISKSRRTPPKRRRPLRLAELRTIATTARTEAVSWPDQIRARRDCLILLLGHLGACRESEIVALRIGDIERVAGGLHVTVRASKTDQDADGMTKGLRATTAADVCPICAWISWRQLIDAHDSGGRPAVIRTLTQHAGSDEHICGDPAPTAVDPQAPLVRWLGRHGWPTTRPIGPHSIYHVVRSRAEKAGLPAHIISQLGGHSLRAGFVTDALDAGAADGEVMRQTGHRSITQVRGYQRGTPLAGNAVNRIDLP